MKRYILIFVFMVILGIVSSQTALAKPKLQGRMVVYQVAQGDTLATIATRYGVTTGSILRQNGLANENVIQVGQQLVIPVPVGTVPSGSVPTVAPTVTVPTTGVACRSYHVVRSGETLSSIAWNYNTTVSGLLWQNNLINQDFIYAGQQLCIPAQSSTLPQQPTTAPPYYHTVTSGETLSIIAARYNVSLWNIVQANNINNAAYIKTGQRLIIPGYQPGQPTVNPTPPQQQAPIYNLPPQQQIPIYNLPPPQQQIPIYNLPPQQQQAPIYNLPPQQQQAPPPNTAQIPVSTVTVTATVPPAPEFQPNPLPPQLPRAEFPVEVLINGGQTWGIRVLPTSFPDPNGITTLVVKTGNELDITVRVRNGDYEVKGKSEFNGEFGPSRFFFRYIPPGDYDVWIDDPTVPSQKVPVRVEAGQRTEVQFSRGNQLAVRNGNFASPDGWYLLEWENPSQPYMNIGGWSNILVQTPASGLNVIIEAEGGYRAECFTGTKGDGACDFAGLSAGFYKIHIDGTDFSVKTYMDGAAYARFVLARQP